MILYFIVILEACPQAVLRINERKTKMELLIFLLFLLMLGMKDN